jgi:ribosome-interacting GTPase 1
VGLVGFPSVGKSTLLNALTNAESEVGSYEFTTLEVVPGMMEHKNANIQVLDLPGLIHGAAQNRGRGKEIISVARNADLTLLVVDPFNPDQLDVIVDELYASGIRLNTSPARVRVSESRQSGGIDVSFTVKPTHLNEELAEEIMDEWGYVNADLVIREDITPDELVDALAGNRVYQKGLVAVNKADQADPELVEQRLEEIRADGWEAIAISAHKQINLEALKDLIYEELDLIRIYLKPQGGDADMEEPLVVRRGSTVGDICDHLHRDMRDRFRYAQVSGDSSQFPDQRVGLDHELADEDILTLITRK